MFSIPDRLCSRATPGGAAATPGQPSAPQGPRRLTRSRDRKIGGVAGGIAPVNHAVDGVGQVIAETIVSWFAQDVNQNYVERLRAAGVDFGDPASAAAAARPRSCHLSRARLTAAPPGPGRSPAVAWPGSGPP